MKYIKRFNESIEDSSHINEQEIDNFLGNGISVNIFLTDLLSDTNLILLMSNGEVYERRSGNKKWDKYSSKKEFKSKTGASLDDEYSGNKSQALLNIFNEVDHFLKYDIEMVYIEDQFGNPLLDSILKKYKNISEGNFIKEEFDIDGYESHWSKFKNWLSEKDFDLYDGEEDLYNKFIEVANDDNFSSEEKADHICSYLEDKWGLYDGYNDTWDYLEMLFMDEI